MAIFAGADDKDLIEQAQKGDREAFSELVCRHRAGVINVVYRMCGDPVLAEDAAQAAFIRAWEHLPGFVLRTTFRSWLYRIAVNAAIDSLRHDKPSLALDDLQLSAPDERAETTLERQEQIREVRKAVLALPEACRAVLVLREYEELSYQEIADTIEIPIGTVMSRLAYARKLLVERLNPMLEVVV